MDLETLMRQLAALEHERWAAWQRWVHAQCDEVNGHLVIPPDLVERWERQIATPFEQLSAAEQASDMLQVERYWPLIVPALESAAARERLLDAIQTGYWRPIDTTGDCHFCWARDLTRRAAYRHRHGREEADACRDCAAALSPAAHGPAADAVEEVNHG